MTDTAHKAEIRKQQLRVMLQKGDNMKLHTFSELWHTTCTTQVKLWEKDNKLELTHLEVLYNKLQDHKKWLKSFHQWKRLSLIDGWNLVPPRMKREANIQDEIYSPYFETYTAHTRDSTTGDCSWLDRFLFARQEVTYHLSIVLQDRRNARTRRERSRGTQLILTQNEKDNIRNLKSEISALFALSCFAPSVQIPDTSRVGRDQKSKWFADGGSFRVFSTQDQKYKPLQVPPKAIDFFWTRLPPHCLSNSEYTSRLNACVAYLSQCTEDGFKDMNERIKETIKKSDEAFNRELTQLVVHVKSPETNMQMLELLSELKLLSI
jgi:hypothetical protein